MKQPNGNILKRLTALAAACTLLLSAGCGQQDAFSSAESDTSTSEAVSNTVPSSSGVSSSVPTRPGGQPSYDIETPPLDKLVIPEGFSIAPIPSGDSNFVPGSLYKAKSSPSARSQTVRDNRLWACGCGIAV